MLTCVYQSPLPLSKNCLLKINRDSKKVIVSKYLDEKGGMVKVEIAPTHQEASLPETCGLSKSELETMAARQARQLETQEQLLAAKAQRLRFLKSGGEAERLQRLRDKVSSQEDRLRKLRALRGKVQNNRGSNAVLSSDLESLRAVFNEKEKELSVAVAKVEDLTRQLDELRRGNSKEPQNGQSAAAVELEKLRRELMYRQKLREAQATRVAVQRTALSQRQEESMRVDRRIAELQDRLHRKRLLNHQLAVTLKHQENVDDFVSGLTKNDPKYQTLPYNTKLFTPFASKHDRDNLEKSVQQMQIMNLDTLNNTQQLDQHQQQYLVHQQQQRQNNQLSQSNKSNHILNYSATYSSNSLQLNNLLSHNQQNAKSVNQQQSPKLSAPSLTHHGVLKKQQLLLSSSPVLPISSVSSMTHSYPQETPNCSPSTNVPWGKSMSVGASNSIDSNSSNTNGNVISDTRSSQSSGYEMTGSPAYVPASSSSFSFAPCEVPPSSQVENSNEASSAGSSVSDGYAPTCGDSGLNSILGAPGRISKPALPPKPSKPTPPPRGQGSHDTYITQRPPTSDRDITFTIMPDRTELPIKPKPLFLKKNNQNTTTSTGTSKIFNNNGSSTPTTLVDNGEARIGEGEKNQTSGSNNNGATVRLSTNRRIEMPPAFLFPESDPPPSDLVPEQYSTTSCGHVCDRNGSLQQQRTVTIKGSSISAASLSNDTPDATPLKTSEGLHAEEYTLPDLFSHSHTMFSSNADNDKGSSVQGRLPRSQHNIGNSNSINSTNPSNTVESLDFFSFQNSDRSIGLNLNNNNSKVFSEPYFANKNHPTSLTPEMGILHSLSVLTPSNLPPASSSPHNNINLSRSANINLSPIIISEATSTSPESPVANDSLLLQQQQQTLERKNLNHVSKMSIQVTENFPGGGSKMDLSPIQLESYEVEQDHPTVGNVIDQNVDRDENASDSAHSGSTSTITTTTSSISSAGAGGVVRILKKGNLKSNNKEHTSLGRRVSFDPLALLLDASLEGELDLVVKTAGEVGNPSAANDEGITALHNAICAGHAEVVQFLVEFGCDVNAQDSDGWTPLHCAASCNNVGIVKFLVERGACIFATTLSDHETAAEKCEEDEDGFGPCSEYLYSIQEKLGILNSGAVYAVFDYDAQNSDELTFRDGNRLVILRKGDEFEREWWWAVLDDKQGYVPRNLLGLYPRVVPHGSAES